MRLNPSAEFVIGGYTKGGRTFDVLVLGKYEGEGPLSDARLLAFLHEGLGARRRAHGHVRDRDTSLVI
jgi:hypothetical protein